MIAAFLVSAALWAPAGAQTAPAAGRLVLVNVLVSDDKGPVEDLKPADLALLDRGIPRKLVFFQRNQAGRTLPRNPLATGWFANRPEYFFDTEPNVTVVLLDGLNTRFADNAAARRKLEQLLSHVGPGVAVYALAPDLRIVSEYTAPSPQPGRPIAALNRSAPPADTDFARATASALSAIADHIAHVSGRRNLVWVSAAFPFPAEAATGAIAIYPVDARALGGTPRTKDAATNPKDLARRTGGLAFNSADALRDVLADSRVNYTLGFLAPAEAFDGTPRELRIATPRPGTTIRFPESWTGTEENTAALTKGDLAALLASPLDSTRLSILARVERTAGVRLALTFNAANLGFSRSDKGILAALDIYCEQQGAGAMVSLRATLSTDDYHRALKNGVHHLMDLPPLPGAARLRVVAHDRTTGRAGSLTVPLPPEAAPDVSSMPVFRTETRLSIVRFRLNPKRKSLITDLNPDDVEIREDGVPQKVALFEGGRLHPRKAPLEISLLFDCSGSVRQAGTLDPEVFHTSLLEEYENVSIGIYGFSDTLVRLTAPTRDRTALRNAMHAVMAVPSGGTPLFQYIAGAIREIASTPTEASRMLIVFSDGESAYPGDQARVQEAIDAALEGGTSIHPVLLSRPVAGTMTADQRRSPSQATSMSSLRIAESVGDYMGLAKATGGIQFDVVQGNESVLPRILKAVAARLRYEYVAGYYPQQSGQRKRHKVEVVLKRKEAGELIGGVRTVVH